MSSQAQLPFYSLAATATALPPEVLRAVEAITNIPVLNTLDTMTLTETTTAAAPIENTAIETLSTTTPATTRVALPKRKAKKQRKFVSSASLPPASPSRLAMRLVNEPTVEGAWPDQMPASAAALQWEKRYAQATAPTKTRSQWLREAVFITLLAVRTVSVALTHSEPWVYKALQASVVGVLCLNVLLGCINVGNQLLVASLQRPFAQELASETQARNHEIQQSLTSLKKGEGLEMLARGYMDMAEPNQVLVKIR